MQSKQCDNCKVTVFIDEGDQCPKDCAKCGSLLNPDFIDEETDEDEDETGKKDGEETDEEEDAK